MRPLCKHSVRLPSWLLVLGGLTTLVPLEALARGGGGEHYTRDSPSYGNGDGDAGLIYLFFRLITFAFRYPKVGIPLLIVAVVVYYFYKRNLHPTGATQRAFERREAEQRTQVSDQAVLDWVRALKRKDPQFEAQGVLDKVRQLFPALQKAWFQRELTPVRPFLSDATYQRFNVQLQLMAAQGVRDAISDIQLLDARIIGLEQSEWFDSLQIRVQAQMRDTDVPASASDAQALEAARRAPLESFTEVWTFVRKPGAVTRIGQDVYQGKCPQCGAPYKGGASNVCEYCQAIVNSGNYDWTLSEITQGIEHSRYAAAVDGLGAAREADPALNLEVLEDRASLLFWKWIDSQSRGDEKRLAQVANTELVSQLGTELSTMRQQGQRRVILECAVGAVVTRTLEVHPEGDDRAHVEIRWSARLGTAAANERPRELPTVPQRWVFTLTRRHGVKTNTSNGMATDRCPECNAPLTSSGASACAYCGTQLGTSARDWVLATTLPYETWEAQTRYRRVPGAQAPVASPARATDTVVDVQERERLLYMMASIAAADGTVDATERKLLKVCATRWSIPWQNVEMALNAGQPLFQRLMPTKGSPEASVFMDHLVQMALVDGRVDMKERRMLVSTAMHLGVLPQLESMLRK